MSWQIFKDNILRYANNPEAIQDIDTIAKVWAIEYDGAVKRGGDSVNRIAVKQGNVEGMTQIFKAALLKGQSSTVPYDLVGELGNGVLAYWGGAILNEFPIPTIPAPGSTINVSIVSNLVNNVGVWQPPIIVPPTSLEAAAAAVKRDIEVEYPISQEIYEAQFDTPIEALENNTDTTQEEAFQSVDQFYAEFDEAPESVDYSSPADPIEENLKDEDPPKPKPKAGKGDLALFKVCGNNYWPALGEPGAFEVSSTNGSRTWYKQNPEYLKANCTQIYIPTSSGNVKVTIHKNLAAIVKPAFEKIKARGLEKYINNCGGGLAVRNVTGGTRLSNHSWGTAIDLNTVEYPYGYKFSFGTEPGIYNGRKKVRDFNDFDNGFIEVAKIFQNQGMTWLSKFDPMHVSIYE
jgi:hypothetical protein